MGGRPAPEAARIVSHPVDLAPFAAADGGVSHVLRLESGRPGPRVGLVALVHGNEPAGARALARLLELGVGPARGALVLILAHPEAAARGVRFLERDLNRIWDRLDEPADGPELRRARLLRPLLSELDVLLDLHTSRVATPPFLIAATDRSLALARALATPPIVVRDHGHAAGRRLVDWGPFADPARRATALLLEAGRHDDPASVDAALSCILALLRHLAMLDAETASWLPPPRPRPVSVLEVTRTVTVDRGPFVFARDIRHFAVLPAAGTLVAHDGPRPVRTPHDDCVVVLPAHRPRPGQTAVRLARLVEGPPPTPAETGPAQTKGRSAR